MPERPDLDLYVDRLAARVGTARCAGLRLASPFVLRTVTPPPEALVDRPVRSVSRLGKRLVLSFEGDLHVAIHLMIAGRLHWKAAGASLRGRHALAALDFPDGSLTLTETAGKKRAALHLLDGAAALAALDRGGVEVRRSDFAGFADALRSEQHTLKRALTDPRILAGIGNAYSDEILWRAMLSPFTRTGSLDDAAMGTLFDACNDVLEEWTERLARQSGDGFPERVTAFHAEMAVHGKYNEPCLRCGTPVQRIVYAANEANYCARCQTGGRLLADRARSRLLKADWPRHIDELEDGS